MGPASSTGFGLQPITWQELEAWQRSMNRWLQPWELLTLRRMSAAYCEEAQKAEAPERMRPDSEAIAADPEARKYVEAAQKMRARLGKGRK